GRSEYPPGAAERGVADGGSRAGQDLLQRGHHRHQRYTDRPSLDRVHAARLRDHYRTAQPMRTVLMFICRLCRYAAGMDDRQRYDRATAALEPPFAILDLDAMRANAASMARRAAGKPIRVATKSLRSRPLLEQVLALDGFRGLLAFTLPEALWLASHGHTDIVVAYPTADRHALAALAGDAAAARHITLTIASPQHLARMDQALAGPRPRHEIRLCLDIDAGFVALGGNSGRARSAPPSATPPRPP